MGGEGRTEEADSADANTNGKFKRRWQAAAGTVRVSMLVTMHSTVRGARQCVCVRSCMCVRSCVRACVCVCIYIYVCNLGLASLASCDLNCLYNCSHCYCGFPLEVSQRGCSLCLNFVQCAKLYVRGSHF